MVEIRRARAADDAAVASVHAAAVRGACRSHYSSEQVEAWAAAFDARGAALRSDDVLLAVERERVLGFGMLDVEGAEVRAVYVRPEAGRRGVGAALLAALERIARLRGLAALRLDASLNAVAFYAAAGWTRTRDTVRVFPGGHDIACVAMTKGLAPLRIVLLEEGPDDAAPVRAVVRAAFARDAEAHLIDRLRVGGGLALSLVALVDGVIVGHLALSPVSVRGAPASVLALSPMAVSPPVQCCGVGSRLVEEALARARERGHPAVVVLGHPGYYPRFGFVPARRFALRYPVQVPDDAFQVAALVPGALATIAGEVRYHAAFDAVG